MPPRSRGNLILDLGVAIDRSRDVVVGRGQHVVVYEVIERRRRWGSALESGPLFVDVRELPLALADEVRLQAGSPVGVPLVLLEDLLQEVVEGVDDGHGGQVIDLDGVRDAVVWKSTEAETGGLRDDAEDQALTDPAAEDGQAVAGELLRDGIPDLGRIGVELKVEQQVHIAEHPVEAIVVGLLLGSDETVLIARPAMMLEVI